MKTILILLSLSLGSFAIADQQAEVQCNIENYKDFIDKPDTHHCNLREADLREANLYKAYLYKANLRRAKVTKEQAKYLREQGLSGFVIVE